MFYTLKHHIVKKGQTLHFISKTAVLESTFGHIYIYIYTLLNSNLRFMKLCAKMVIRDFNNY